MNKNVMIVLCGNCRTFIECFDNVYSHIISKLFSEEYNIYLYFYLKLSDSSTYFKYHDIEYNTVLDKINKIINDYPMLHIEYKLLADNEITDNEIMLQVKNRDLYNTFYARDDILLRGLHCHYNFEKCGTYLLEKEKSLQCHFDSIVYVRPDLFFTSHCDAIETYSTSNVTLGFGPEHRNNDHIAIIPRKHLEHFFFDRMNLYRNNTIIHFGCPEEVYWHTIPHEEKRIGTYYIKRS